MLENMTRLEDWMIQGCNQLEELPHHIINQASLTELNISSNRLRELPVNIGQLSKLRKIWIASTSLTSLPTSIGDMSSLTSLELANCRKLECLPESLWHLSLLSNLRIDGFGVKYLPNSVGRLINLQALHILCCPISELDLGAGLFTYLKGINLESTEVSKFLISEDSPLEWLSLGDNIHLEDIVVLPSTLESIVLRGYPKLDVIPCFAQLGLLREFVLEGCYRVKKIQGLEHCRALETLKAHTRWEEASIESLKSMERLRKVELQAISRSGVEGCIKSMQKWPKEEIIVCTLAVSDAATLVNSFPNLSVVDSFTNQKMSSNPSLKCSPIAGCILLCFVMSCDSPKTELQLAYSTENRELKTPIWDYDPMELENGKWVWTALFTQHSRIHNSISGHTQSWVSLWSGRSKRIGEVEKGVLVMGEEEIVMEAFTRLCVLLAN